MSASSSFDDTENTSDNIDSFINQAPRPGLLLAHGPKGASPIDRCFIGPRFVLGRKLSSDLAVSDKKISARHFCISKQDDECLIEDLRSTNGTYLNGIPVKGATPLADQSVIRAGHSLFVFRSNAAPLMGAIPGKRYGMAGRFHTPVLLKELEEAALSGRHILITGETGVGKELTAHALAALMGKPGPPLALSLYNDGQFASREEAISTLFGVAPRFFSGVDARIGLIEKANRGVLFLDELHNLPIESQRMLLRVIEDGRVTRLGESNARPVNVRFIVASNEGGDTCGLARDLYARLRQVALPPLNERGWLMCRLSFLRCSQRLLSVNPLRLKTFLRE